MKGRISISSHLEAVYFSPSKENIQKSLPLQASSLFKPILKVTTPSPQALDPNNWMGKDLKLAKHLISPQLFTVAVFGAYRLPASLWFYRPERFATHAAAIDASSQELHNQQAVVESYKAMHNVDTIDESYKDLHKV
ncbi:uncharacterized protein MELLADRAFT_104758 [Melampsora larici-populina 98AG31]|uniref:Uncharacterized protein n=1 Tax=Melampsora larici-populina (strain 98AG31 / pathotype 3-4-7) TaxID=747676 RepID=F4RFT5_MELLP|nr:uncharacterized protein MELLADRAFT_104758 [Melampsora larici-populina 98AG31]EGG08863.1 hypothetical protein MELLADRAFT_104758 [Melampsora larici-populina 98AG31]